MPNEPHLSLPPHEYGLTLSHNAYRSFHETIEEAVADIDLLEGWAPGERDEVLRTGEIWILQWYPYTPLSFELVAASSLDALMAAVEEMRDAQ